MVANRSLVVVVVVVVVVVAVVVVVPIDSLYLVTTYSDCLTSDCFLWTTFTSL